ncbi:MAG: hypothetical protein FWC09_10300, partial [Lachnospiraceae bacterium]|nr:hypothetical protein [Lachnospiraceae bacterium]
IIARVYAQEGVWDALNEFHVVISRGVNEGFYFNKSDVEVPLSQILPGVADLRTFGVDRSAVSLNAIDNGDGTLTFTLKDTSAKSMYMYPWSWIDYSDAHYEIYSGMECKWHVAGHLSYDPRSDVAIYSDFGFGRSVGYNTGDSTRPGNWKQMMVDMALEIMGEAAIEPPIDPNSPRAPILDTGPNYNDVSDSLSVTVDENGLTATFTQSFLSGYTLDDVAAFRVVLLYRVSGSAFGHKFIDVEESFGFEVSDVIE